MMSSFRSILGSIVLILSTDLLASEQQLNGHLFTLPEGFEIEIAAKSPLVDRPITMDFDELGRLYVADSSGSNDPVQKQLENPTHRIVRLEDIDGDGRFDKSIVFADKMMFPEGTLWHDGSLYVAAPPSIWKLTDTNDDGVADKREEWFKGKTLTGCANDLHGPYLGPDGYIYWAKGAFAEQTHEQPNGKKPLVTKASHLFRRRADGSGFVENVMTGGMDNPVDVVFTPGGERIFTTTFLQNPGNGLRDGLIHAVYGGVYGKVHNVTDFHPRTGDLMPPLVHMGAAAPCGLASYESEVFGPEYRDNLFACQFNMYKVSRHELRPKGATFESKDSDFVVSNNLDFHPTDVMEDADGSLVICDTGGWYKLCCPTSQIGKPEVLGALYRVRKSRAKRIEDPRGVKLEPFWGSYSDKDLIDKLADPRPAVRAKAMRRLADRGAGAVSLLADVLRNSNSAQLRRDAVWTLTRMDHDSARKAVRVALADTDETVSLASLHSVSLWRDREAIESLHSILKSGSAARQRVAAEALGRIGDKASVPPLLEAAAQPNRKIEHLADRVLEHSITFALIEIGDFQQTAEGLTSPDTWARRVALIALDQMVGPGLKSEQVVPLLSSEDHTLRQTSLWLVARHSEWGNAVADHLRMQLAKDGWRTAEQNELRRMMAQFAGTIAVQELMASHIAPGVDSDREFSVKLMVLNAMGASGLKEMPQSWVVTLASFLEADDTTLKSAAIEAVRGVPLPKTGTEFLVKALRQTASSDNLPAETRVAALAAIPVGAGPLEPQHVSLLIGNLGDDASVVARSAAVEALLKTKLTVDQQSALADAIPRVGPLELNRLLAAFEAASDESVGRKLVASLKKSPVLTSLRVDAVKQRLTKFPTAVQQEAEQLYAAINADAAKQKERLDELVAHAGEGDVLRGQIVFANTKAACIACHAIGYKGGNIGPDLSRIGKIRTERDLLESLLFPSVSFVRSYEPVLIVTKEGKQVNGLIRRETPDEIVLATGAKEEARVARADIEEILPGTVSVMPAGLDTQLTREQLLDLIAFLKSRQ